MFKVSWILDSSFLEICHSHHEVLATNFDLFDAGIRFQGPEKRKFILKITCLGRFVAAIQVRQRFFQ